MEELKNLFEGFNVNTGWLTIVLAIFMVADIATGLLKAYKKGIKINSSKLRDGGFKKAGMIIVCALGYTLSVLFTDTSYIIYNTIVAYYLYTEIVSNLENIEEMGIPLPNMLSKIINNKNNNNNN